MDAGPCGVRPSPDQPDRGGTRRSTLHAHLGKSNLRSAPGGYSTVLKMLRQPIPQRGSDLWCTGIDNDPSFGRSDRAHTRLFRADADGLFNAGDENFTVTALAGAGGVQHGVESPFDQMVGQDDFQLDLG